MGESTEWLQFERERELCTTRTERQTMQDFYFHIKKFDFILKSRVSLLTGGVTRLCRIDLKDHRSLTGAGHLESFNRLQKIWSGFRIICWKIVFLNFIIINTTWWISVHECICPYGWFLWFKNGVIEVKFLSQNISVSPNCLFRNSILKYIPTTIDVWDCVSFCAYQYSIIIFPESHLIRKE